MREKTDPRGGDRSGALADYVRDLEGCEPLSAEAERELHGRMHAGDPAARDRLIRSQLRWVMAIARQNAERERLADMSVQAKGAARSRSEERPVRRVPPPTNPLWPRWRRPHERLLEQEQGPRFPAEELRRRLRVSWAVLARFGIGPERERLTLRGLEARYSLAIFGRAVEQFRELPPPAGGVVTVYVVRRLDGEILSRHFRRSDAEGACWVHNKNISWRDDVPAVIEEMTAELRPVA
jgi:hypothetical protein